MRVLRFVTATAALVNGVDIDLGHRLASRLVGAHDAVMIAQGCPVSPGSAGDGRDRVDLALELLAVVVLFDRAQRPRGEDEAAVALGVVAEHGRGAGQAPVGRDAQGPPSQP